MKPPVRDPAWNDEMIEIWRNDLREIWDPRIERHSFHCYHNQLDLYLALVERYGVRTVLDVGCAQGTLALMLAEAGRKVTAIDIRQSFLDYARSRWERGDVRFLAANIFDKPDLGAFDMVFANQIVEHVVYPADLLRILSGYLAPGGAIVITTPNHDYVRNVLPSYSELGDPAAHEHKQFTAGGAGHFFAYTERELRDAARAASLAVVEARYFESPWVSGHIRLRHLHGIVPIAVLRVLDRFTLLVAGRRLGHQMMMVMQKEPRR